MKKAIVVLVTPAVAVAFSLGGISAANAETASPASNSYETSSVSILGIDLGLLTPAELLNLAATILGVDVSTLVSNPDIDSISIVDAPKTAVEGTDLDLKVQVGSNTDGADLSLVPVIVKVGDNLYAGVADENGLATIKVPVPVNQNGQPLTISLGAEGITTNVLVPTEVAPTPGTDNPTNPGDTGTTPGGTGTTPGTDTGTTPGDGTDVNVPVTEGAQTPSGSTVLTTSAGTITGTWKGKSNQNLIYSFNVGTAYAGQTVVTKIHGDTYTDTIAANGVATISIKAPTIAHPKYNLTFTSPLGVAKTKLQIGAKSTIASVKVKKVAGSTTKRVITGKVRANSHVKVVVNAPGAKPKTVVKYVKANSKGIYKYTYTKATKSGTYKVNVDYQKDTKYFGNAKGKRFTK